MTFTPRPNDELRMWWEKYLAEYQSLDPIMDVDRWSITAAKANALHWLNCHTEGHPEEDQHYLSETELRAQLPILDADIIRCSTQEDPLADVSPTLLAQANPEQLAIATEGVKSLQARCFMAQREVILYALGERSEP